MKRLFKVRFHLGKGENYMKWRVENTSTNFVEFFDYKDYDIEMINCKLYNQEGAAEKIFKGDNKTVCAWIMCEKVALVLGGNRYRLPKENIISYNPKVKPYWLDFGGENIDKSEFELIETIGKKLYAT